MRTRVFDICIACCAALTLFAAGCDKGGGGGGSEGGGGSGGDDGAKGRSGKPPIEKEVYIDASFDIQCVDKHLGSELDLERVKEDIFGKHEIKKKKYEKAKEYFSTLKKENQEDDDEEAEDKKTEEEEEIAERLEEDCSKAKAKMLAGQAPIDKEAYVDATYELSCVEEHYGDSDDHEMEDLEAHVYERQDIDSDTYEMAEEFYSDKDEINDKIKSKMEEDCTDGRAMAYAGLEPQRPAYVGSLSGRSSQGGFGPLKVSITISGDYSAYGNISGAREGNGFRVPLEGRISKNNRISLSGSSGQNNAKLSGKIGSGGGTVNVSGSLFGRSFNASVRVN